MSFFSSFLSSVSFLSETETEIHQKQRTRDKVKKKERIKELIENVSEFIIKLNIIIILTTNITYSQLKSLRSYILYNELNAII